jgi:hypothetical protein
MNQIPDYLYAQGEGLGAGVIIMNQTPPFVGRVIQYEDYLTMQSILSKSEPIAFATVQGYSIAIIYGGILGKGHRIPAYQGALEEIQSILEQMAHYYLQTRILPHQSRFKRFLL